MAARCAVTLFVVVALGCAGTGSGQSLSPNVASQVVAVAAAGAVGAPSAISCRPSPPYVECCRAKSYNPFNATCCGGVLTTNRTFAACCGTTPIDADIQGCCNGRVVALASRRAPLSCCGTAGYDPAKQICCGSTVATRSPTVGCCGGRLYNVPPIGLRLPPVYSQCCGCKLFKVSGVRGASACCDDQPYYPASQACCNGAILSTAGLRSPRCCGAVLVDGSKSTACCQGRPYQSGPFGPMCCPDGSLNSCCFFPQFNSTACI